MEVRLAKVDIQSVLGVFKIDNFKGPQRVGLYRNDLSNYEGESVDDDISAILVRGTEGSEERLDPSTSKSYLNETLD